MYQLSLEWAALHHTTSTHKQIEQEEETEHTTQDLEKTPCRTSEQKE
jgi:hypothetical protein